MGFKYNENCNSIYGGVILPPYLAVFFSNIVFFLFQYIMVNYVFPVAVFAFHFALEVEKEYHNLRFLHIGQDDRTEWADFKAAVYLSMGYDMKDLHTLQWWHSIMNDHDDPVDQISLFPVMVPTPEQHETEKMFQRMEKSFGYHYAFFICQLAWVLYEVVYYISSSQTQTLYSGSSSWLQYNYFIGFLVNSSFISLLYMAIYIAFLKELYFPFRHYWAEDARAGEIVFYIPHLYEAHAQRVYCVKIISVDSYVSAHGVTMPGSGFGKEPPSTESLYTKPGVDARSRKEVAFDEKTSNKKGKGKGKSKGKSKGNRSQGVDLDGAPPRSTPKQKGDLESGGETVRGDAPHQDRPRSLKRLQRWLSGMWYRSWARRHDDDPPVDPPPPFSPPTTSASEVALVDVAGGPVSSIAGLSPSRPPGRRIAPKPPQSPGLPLYMAVLNERKSGYELPYYLREDRGEDIVYTPPPPCSTHRFGHRYYIQFLDDIYHHQPRKVTMLHLFHTPSAAKLELQFHRYEHLFEPLLVATMIIAMPLAITHLLPGLVMYAWVVALWVFVGTLIGIALQLVWIVVGPGLDFDCTDTLKREIVQQFFARLLLRVVLVLVVQTLVNYMSLYYYHIADLGTEEPVSGGYLTNLIVEFNLRTQSLYPCYLGAVLDGPSGLSSSNSSSVTDTQEAAFVHAYNVLVTLDWL